MEDLIRRSDAIKAVEEAFNLGDSHCDRYGIRGVINAIPSIDRWIPCSEGMPKKTGYYICTCKDGAKYKRTTVVKWSNGWQLTGSRSYWVVVAWMPLPEPWKGADDE